METIVRDLRHQVMGMVITGLIVKASAQKSILKTTPRELYEGIINESVLTVLRRGKYIIIPLSNNNVLVMHLGMTGKILLEEPPDLDFEERLEGDAYVDNNTHLVIELIHPEDEEAPEVDLHFNDPRMFGKIWLVQDVQDINQLNVPGLKDLGPDALGISLGEFEGIMHRRRTVKAVLLDQSKIAGVGNIYADEACFAAGVHPSRKAISLSDVELTKLWFAVKTVLKLGIKYRGSSTSDYVSIDGSKGSFQDHHRVYGKAGEKCTLCTSAIEKIKVAGRSTHFCPGCQAEGG